MSGRTTPLLSIPVETFHSQEHGEWLFISTSLLPLPKGGNGTYLIGQFEKRAEPVDLTPLRPACLDQDSAGKVHSGLLSATWCASWEAAYFLPGLWLVKKFNLGVKKKGGQF